MSPWPPLGFFDAGVGVVAVGVSAVGVSAVAAFLVAFLAAVAVEAGGAAEAGVAAEAAEAAAVAASGGSGSGGSVVILALFGSAPSSFFLRFLFCATGTLANGFAASSSACGTSSAFNDAKSNDGL